MFMLSHANTLFFSDNPVVVVLSYLSEINVKLAEKYNFVTHCVKNILKCAKLRKHQTFWTRKLYRWPRKVPSVRQSSETKNFSNFRFIFFQAACATWNNSAEIFRLKQTRAAPAHGKMIWRERFIEWSTEWLVEPHMFELAVSPMLKSTGKL